MSESLRATVAGIDFSSHQADVVLLDESTDHATHHVFKFGRGDAFDRARTIRYSMPSRSWWEDEGVIAIGIEDPRGVARSADAPLYRAQGAILVCLPQLLLVQPWKPGEWRKQLGIANTGKVAPAAFALERWLPPVGVWTQDMADAYCLAYATRQRIEVTKAEAA